MPTNANTFNSRVTSEALEAKFRQTFPSQGGAELPQDLFASGVIQPVVDFTAVAEGSGLREDLQRAWDFSTGSASISNTTTTLISNTGFWKVQFAVGHLYNAGPTGRNAQLRINDGVSTKVIWALQTPGGETASNEGVIVPSEVYIVFLRSGDSLEGSTNQAGVILDVTYRQIADVYGNFVNPLGFTFS